MVLQDVDDEIMRLWFKGYEPSKINKVLKIDNAKSVIIRHWINDDVTRCKYYIENIQRERGLLHG